MTTPIDTMDNGSPRRTNKERRSFAIKNLFGLLFYGLLLFLPAGTLNWPAAWVYLGLFLLVLIASSIYTDPELLRDERGVGQAGRKNWDLALVSVYGLLTSLATPIVAGLDWRNGWSASQPLWVPLLAAILFSLGWAFGLWAMTVNRFFSKVVRIQHERGHHVIQEGPYRFVRHPGYVGAIIQNLTTAVILGSWWAMIPAGVGSVIMILRTALEDRTLQNELEGYAGYSGHVRFRLIPGIW